MCSSDLAPLWMTTLWVIMTWLPVFVVGEIALYERYGFYAIFVGLAVLQVGHLCEHTAQMTQLLVTNGDLARSHGRRSVYGAGRTFEACGPFSPWMISNSTR